uniref:Nucleoid-associated protein n=1 Tax=Dunaliella tertiolecta TaxID=3047 RepID=A0A7S3VKW8_DUNTE|mmetsp:Transcript_20789/g.54209  ORF Transcript_20789/g.54209 Transcript_20789/m.54209 type:complete len:168 (-) Transcript_20789:590-1093(-)|eukprot:CAMPEP_0202346860 /NCGR_PEP_ID=MMETSP1126-20121109/5469_1 /ASSEMBLY_ACC=CAM_ASM_000457 /TAXON_ID=3047 /ORGANISM="Dunaliella tertiolecta, Strain CCMP1320" /LENGTH=167 /DNA_ID=CAMNT_0048938327 /DNA_START=57 /DNA_END=560 /DNA_ORIENTATION=-
MQALQCTSSRTALARNISRPARLTSRVHRAPARSSRGVVRVDALFGGGNKEGGGGGNPFDMKNMMEAVKKAQTLVQAETQKVQQELAETEFEGFDEEETVRVVMTGNQAPKSVDITQEGMDAGKEELSKRVTAAMQDSHTKSVAGMKEKMQTLAKTLGIPNPNQLGM